MASGSNPLPNTLSSISKLASEQTLKWIDGICGQSSLYSSIRWRDKWTSTSFLDSQIDRVEVKTTDAIAARIWNKHTFNAIPLK